MLDTEYYNVVSNIVEHWDRLGPSKEDGQAVAGPSHATTTPKLIPQAN
jgi:hypothetical protein